MRRGHRGDRAEPRGATGYQEIDSDIVADQIRAVVTDIGSARRRPGCLRAAPSSRPSLRPAPTSVSGRRPDPAGRRPGLRVHARRPLLAAEALDDLRGSLIPRATVVTPNLDEVRLITGIDVDVGAQTQMRARRHAPLDLGRGGHW